MEVGREYITNNGTHVVYCGLYNNSIHIMEIVDTLTGNIYGVPIDNFILEPLNWTSRYNNRYWMLLNVDGFTPVDRTFGTKHVKKHKFV